ncbi:MAG: hypothetical protein ACFFEO_17435, partial [Candidatus Thorarchaeota archaeon]
MRKIKEIYMNLILTAIIAISSLFIGLVISFIFSRLMPGDPVAAWLVAQGIHNPDQFTYSQMKHALGLDLPVFIQFFKYIGDFFSGNWGISVSIVRNQPVYDLISSRMPFSIDLCLIPMVIGIYLGSLLGIISFRNRRKIKGKIIQAVSAFIIAIPVFFLGMSFQYTLGYLAGLFDPTGYLSPQYTFPPSVTGFIIIDAALAGQQYLIGDYMWHMFLPVFCLSFFMIGIITWLTRSYLAKKSEKSTVISITTLSGIILGFVFMSVVLIETTFGLSGIGRLLIEAFLLYDYWVLKSVLFIVVIVFVAMTLTINLHFILYKFLLDKGVLNRFSKIKIDNPILPKEEHNKLSSNDNIKDYSINRLKSPSFIIGSILILFFIVISIAPQLITPYSYEYLRTPQSGSWNPPSPEHPLGQTIMGGDVLGRTIFGIRDSLISSSIMVIIGVIGGVNLGFIAGRYKRIGYKPIMGILIIFYILPGFLYALLTPVIYGPFNPMFVIIIIGILLI